MDQSLYKDFTTSRGFIYHYLFSPGDASKPVLLFLHGFPSTSYDWKHQIAFFKEKGYPLIVPDMLGYGGTSKPVDPMQYRHRLLAQDIVEILDTEKVARVIAVGHDWGCVVTSRLADYYPDRCLAYGFLAAGYYPASQPLAYEAMMQLMKSMIGTELIGYWDLFAEDGADVKIDNNLESMYSLLYCADHDLWKDYMQPIGGLRLWVESNRTTPIGSYLTEEDQRIQKEELRKGGIKGPLCYYKAVRTSIMADDSKGKRQYSLGPLCSHAPEANPPKIEKVSKPVFFGGASKDYVCLAHMSLAGTTASCEDTTSHVYDTGHWVQLEAKDEVNRDLLAWIQAVEVKTA
ncbi:Alpha/Beta hydrolase protein [Desarmillaria tabescens]|uniref:Alpha/Beta hydrolase protein n=1 Tax=Armillaria tabescens TaxID=1929756 RepID=A0AA39TTB5_ARMTA|nr:Alpha/Beta hydrolase protein [Desarmillaria tabescens]KAK0462974.1 Alpha/Beta hydrolase protein [Desarmillaria tabescens]